MGTCWHSYNLHLFETNQKIKIMATFTNLRYIAQSIADNIGKPLDIPLIRRLEREVISKQATLLRNDFTKNKMSYSQLMQDISCLALDKVDIKECCSSVIEDCSVSKTLQTVPTPVRFKEAVSPFSYVGGTDKSTPYTWTTPEQMPMLVKGRRYKLKDMLYYTYLNGHIYVFSPFGQDTVKKVNIRGVFEDPREIQKLKDCNGKNCSLPGDIPIPLDMEDAIKKLIYAELSAMQPKQPQEITTDGSQVQS